MNNLDVEKALKLPNLVKTGNFNFKTGLKTKGKIYIFLNFKNNHLSDIVNSKHWSLLTLEFSRFYFKIDLRVIELISILSLE